MLFWFVFLWYILMSVGQNGQKSYRNYSVLNITPIDEDQYGFLVQLSHDSDVDFWRGPRPAGANSLVMVAPQHRRNIEEILSSKGIQYSVIIEDVQEQIDEERRNIESTEKRLRRAPTNDSESFFLKYHNLNEIYRFIQSLNTRYPHISLIKSIGKTYHRRKMNLIKIGSQNRENKPFIWIDGCIHAREWISASTAIYIAYQLLTKYNADESVKKLVDYYDWYILPVANPDGYYYSHTRDRLWRKNLNPTPGTPYFGVDINRNFDYMWNTSEQERPRQPQSQTYQGTEPFSEKESTAISMFLMSRKKPPILYLGLHSYGPLWLTPYGQEDHYPPNFDELINLAEIGNEAMQSYNGTTLPIIPSFELAPNTGSSLDWAYTECNAFYSYILEMDVKENRFETPVEKIVPFGEEVSRAVNAMALKLSETEK